MITLSIRQPWAWLIVNGHKDIENRDWHTYRTGQVLIHAGKTMARRYYDDVLYSLEVDTDVPKAVIDSIPAYEALERGGVVGVATIAGCVIASDSPWFQGPYGFVMRDARPLPFFAVNGKLGLFDVRGVDLGHA